MTTTYLNQYEPPSWAVLSVVLVFDLYDDHAMIENTMVLTRQRLGVLHLHGDGLELMRVVLNNAPLSASDYRVVGDDLLFDLPDEVTEVTLFVVTRVHPQDNTLLSGLYRSNNLFCTQCEAQGFRRITYFPDRPDVLTVFQTTIVADKARFPVLLSNGHCIDTYEVSGQRHAAVWHDPFKKPAYLFALVAGDLACVTDHFITCSGRRIELRIYVDLGNEDKCAHAMVSLKHAMRWDETQFGREYDLDLFMIVAVNDFNMGAMENKGLNIFNAKYILARPDTATDADYAGIEGVVAHEYFHNWTGNRVTCRDWFQLSLKEGLTVFRDQEFSRDMNSREVNRIDDVKTLRQVQFPEDAGRMAHPVQPKAYEEINNFYTATVYEKGAEVIRMQETLLGKEGFRRGMDLYFERHDGQAVTIEDFVAAMSDANGVDLSQFLRWYHQAGTPIVCLDSYSHSNSTLRLSFTQSCPQTPDGVEKQPFVIPLRVAFYTAEGKPLEGMTDLLVMTQATQVFEVHGLSAPPLVSLLRDFSAPVHLQRDMSVDDCLLLLRCESNGYCKWDAGLRVAQRVVAASYASALANDWQWDDLGLFEAQRDILNHDALDLALRAELVMPVGYHLLAESLTEVDIDCFERVRDYFNRSQARALSDDAWRWYERLWAEEDHAMHGHAYNRRRLRNVCLHVMMKSGNLDAVNRCEQQFTAARTMTDQLASFSLLVNDADDARHADAIARFYHQWQHEPLVMDKWFSVQAACERDGALARVKTLMQHPLFTLKNPNKVRALLGVFCQNNRRHFHAKDGSGYQFLAHCLLQLDPINAQIAARLATPFTQWQRVDKSRQAMMQQQLQQLSDANLSNDLREIVDKSLAV